MVLCYFIFIEIYGTGNIYFYFVKINFLLTYDLYDPHSFSKLDLDPHSLKKLDPDPHSLKKLDPDSIKG
jgi:hypothetical protein